MMQFPWPGLGLFKKLSAEEATEFAARVAELTKAQLPLGAGLRALAEELPGRRLPRMLRDVAHRLDAGDDLLQALESQGARLPVHLRGLMLAGVRTGRLADVLEEYVDLQYSQAELRRRVAAALAYPYVLLLFMTGLTLFAGHYLVDPFAKIFRDFGTELPAMTWFVISEARPIMWFFVSLAGLSVAIPVLLRMAPAAGWIWRVVYRVPLVGPLLRWSHLAQFARLMGLLLEQQVPLPDALRVTAVGLPSGSLARGCWRAADDVEKGRPLGESLAAQRQFPASLIPVIQWGQQAPALPDAFRSAAEMFEGRSRAQSMLLETMVLPVMFLVIVTFVGFFIIAMFLPLIALISKLS